MPICWRSEPTSCRSGSDTFSLLTFRIASIAVRSSGDSIENTCTHTCITHNIKSMSVQAASYPNNIKPQPYLLWASEQQ
jgi:hypothetical protein